VPCVEHSDRQTCLEGFTSGRPQEEIDSKMPNLRYAHWYAHDTHRRIDMHYAAGRACSLQVIAIYKLIYIRINPAMSVLSR